MHLKRLNCCLCHRLQQVFRYGGAEGIEHRRQHSRTDGNSVGIMRNTILKFHTLLIKLDEFLLVNDYPQLSTIIHNYPQLSEDFCLLIERIKRISFVKNYPQLSTIIRKLLSTN